MLQNWFFLILALALVNCQQPPNNDVILFSKSESNYDGTYKYSYETSNGIKVQEEGSLKNPGTGEAQSARGTYSYTAPNGQVITVNWYADETGFHANTGTNFQQGSTPEPERNLEQNSAAEAAPEFFRG